MSQITISTTSTASLKVACVGSSISLIDTATSVSRYPIPIVVQHLPLASMHSVGVVHTLVDVQKVSSTSDWFPD